MSSSLSSIVISFRWCLSANVDLIQLRDVDQIIRAYHFQAIIKFRYGYRRHLNIQQVSCLWPKTFQFRPAAILFPTSKSWATPKIGCRILPLHAQNQTSKAYRFAIVLLPVSVAILDFIMKVFEVIYVAFSLTMHAIIRLNNTKS